MGIGRRFARRRLHRDDGDSAQRSCTARTAALARAIHPLRCMRRATEQVWSFDRVADATRRVRQRDYAHAGALMCRSLSTGAISLPQPRAAVYALGAVASASGRRLDLAQSAPTSRFRSRRRRRFTRRSIPIIRTSNSISNRSRRPYIQRTIREVRPFFTQAANFYDIQLRRVQRLSHVLYTPGIPTPSQGYAFEGKQGNFGFTGFDAIGDQRNDSAAALTYTTHDTHWNGVVQPRDGRHPGHRGRFERRQPELVQTGNT